MRDEKRVVASSLRRLLRYTMGGLSVVLLLGAAPAAAQSRSASIRVNVTVRGLAESDMLGVRDVGIPDGEPAVGGDALGSEGWRIMAGGSPEMTVQLEPATGPGPAARTPPVAVCEILSGGRNRCRAHQPAHATMRLGERQRQYLVRLDRGARAADGPVRVTLAYVGL
jgi:hypothetical protein